MLYPGKKIQNEAFNKKVLFLIFKYKVFNIYYQMKFLLISTIIQNVS